MSPILIQGIALGLTAAASPGAFQAFLIAQTLNGGARRGITVAIAPLLSDPPVVLVILLLLDQLPEQFLRVISLSGGAFALYLTWGLLRRLRQGGNSTAENGSPNTNGSILWRAALLNALSPGVYTFWTLVNGPLLLDALHQSLSLGGAFLAGFYVTFIGGMLVLVLIFSQARRLGERIIRLLTFSSALILFAFAIYLLLNGLFG